MAQGDVITNGGRVYNAGTVDFRPSSGVEWCVTSVSGSSYTQLFWMWADNSFNENTSGSSTSQMEQNKSFYGIPANGSQFFSYTRYFKLKGTNSNSTYHYGHYFGIQSK